MQPAHSVLWMLIVPANWHVSVANVEILVWKQNRALVMQHAVSSIHYRLEQWFVNVIQDTLAMQMLHAL